MIEEGPREPCPPRLALQYTVALFLGSFFAYRGLLGPPFRTFCPSWPHFGFNSAQLGTNLAQLGSNLAQNWHQHVVKMGLKKSFMATTRVVLFCIDV